jgi:hypothetical protein
MKNTLTDLNNHLFAQLERIGNESLTKDQLQDEINRSKAITSLGSVVVANARVVLDAQNAMFDTPNYERKELPSILK